MNAYIPYLKELRARLIRITCIILVLFFSLFWVDGSLYAYIAQPLLMRLPSGSALLATEITTPFIIPMKLAFILSIFCAAPYILYQLWSFIVPGLYKHEKQKILPFLLLSTFLFYAGAIFAYYIICPLALGFFVKSAPLGVKVMPDIRVYLDFMVTMLLAGGAAFQAPVLTLLLLKYQVISINRLEYCRPYIIVGAFTLGMLLTPPDVISQILLALPIWGLLELAILFAKYSRFMGRTVLTQKNL